MPLLSRIRSAALSPGLLIAMAVALVAFVTAYDDGSFSLPSRDTLAIAVWWTVIVGVALRTLTLENVTRASLAMGGVLAALGAWTFASVFWAPSAENAFNEVNRVSLFLGLFVLATLAARRSSILRWCNGLAIAISGIAFIALVSRFFPGTFSTQGLASLHSVAARLSFPLGYWNGLAIFVALDLPLLLRIAVASDHVLARGLAIVPMPAIVSVVFLASSRGGALAAAVGVVAFLALGERRSLAAGALFWGAAGAAAAIAVLASRNVLVNGPLGTSLQKSEGRTATVLVALICILSGTAYTASQKRVRRLVARGVSRFLSWLGRSIGFSPEVRSRLGRTAETSEIYGRPGWIYRPAETFAVIRRSPWAGRATVASVVGIFAIAVVMSHPIRQFDAFKRPPQAISTSKYAREHLLSTSGSGRWQFWTQAVKQWEKHPVVGNGAGSYEAWWLKHMPASFPQPVQNAHSLYIQSLGELGIPGLALTLALALGGIGIGIRRSLQSSGERRLIIASLAAVFTAFAVAAAFDWVWELTVVAGVGIVALALLSSGAGTDPGPPRLVRPNEARRARQLRFGMGVMSLVLVWLLICAQGIPLLAQLRLKDSVAYAKEGSVNSALQAAMDARNLQPWASSPYLQLALVAEYGKALTQAHTWIKQAIDRDPTNWDLWLTASRIEFRQGKYAASSRSFDRACSLNPRSLILSCG